MQKDIVTSSLNYDGRRFRTTRKEQLNTFKEIWKKEINGVTMPSSGEDGIVKSVNQVARLVANRDPFSSVESIVKRK